MAVGKLQNQRLMTTAHSLSVGSIQAHSGADATSLTITFPQGYTPLFPIGIGTDGGRIVASCYFGAATGTTIQLRAWVVNPYEIAATNDTVNVRVVWQKT